MSAAPLFLQHTADRHFASALNDLGVRPESGSPMLLSRTGALAYWDLDAQRWIAGPAR